MSSNDPELSRTEPTLKGKRVVFPLRTMVSDLSLYSVDEGALGFNILGRDKHLVQHKWGRRYLKSRRVEEVVQIQSNEVMYKEGFR